MIDELHELDHGTCMHCGERITQYEGDLTGVGWFHDATGRRECPGSTYATPEEQR